MAFAARVRSCIGALERSVKKLNKKAAGWKKELFKIRKALDKTSTEVDRLRTINRWSVVTYSAEKAQLAAKFARLSKLVEDGTWGEIGRAHV